MNNTKDVCSLAEKSLLDSGIWKSESARNHLLSPQPFYLTKDQFAELEQIGQAILAFYTAANKLYMHKGNDWVNEYLDLGKPEETVRHSRMNYHKQLIPRVLRPDILLTDKGFVITELDSVPGGIGHLACLSSAYQGCGYDIIGGREGMVVHFAAAMKEACSQENPNLAIVVSEESEDYRPEMQYLAQQLRRQSMSAYCLDPSEMELCQDSLTMPAEAGDLPVDLVYRFYELFDLDNIPNSALLLQAAGHKKAVFQPPHKHFLEEKLLLALLHHRALEQFWSVDMGNNNYNLLRKYVVDSWILDNRPVPPHAEISGFTWENKPVSDWRTISQGTQKQRALVIKPSGFSPLAWGSRGVRVGSDMSATDWSGVVDRALEQFDQAPSVLQTFREAKKLPVEYIDDKQTLHMQARVRLCPYYFVHGERANLAGVLATACPEDKKLIHGMKDAIIVPCAVSE